MRTSLPHKRLRFIDHPYACAILLLNVCLIIACSSDSTPTDDESRLPSILSLSVNPVSAGTIASKEYFSSTSLAVYWTADGSDPEHWKIIADGSTGDTVIRMVRYPSAGRRSTAHCSIYWTCRSRCDRAPRPNGRQRDRTPAPSPECEC